MAPLFLSRFGPHNNDIYRNAMMNGSRLFPFGSGEIVKGENCRVEASRDKYTDTTGGSSERRRLAMELIRPRSRRDRNPCHTISGQRQPKPAVKRAVGVLQIGPHAPGRAPFADFEQRSG